MLASILYNAIIYNIFFFVYTYYILFQSQQRLAQMTSKLAGDGDPDILSVVDPYRTGMYKGKRIGNGRPAEPEEVSHVTRRYVHVPYNQYI